MPDVNPFDAVFGQQKPQQSQSAPVSQPASSGGGNPFDTVFGPGNHTQPDQTPATSTHGALYNAADSVLNSPLPGKTDSGHPMLDQIGDFAKSLNPIDMGRGIVKGALSTAAGVGSIVNRLTGAPSDKPTTNFNQENLSGLTDANNAGQGIGKYGEQAAELMGGEGIAAKTMPGLLGKMATSGAISGVQSGGSTGATAIGAVLPGLSEKLATPAASWAGKAASKFLGGTSGAGEAAIARAFLHPDSSGLAKVMRGETNVNDVVGELQSSVKNLRDQAGQTYKASLNGVTNQQIPGWHAKSGQAVQAVNDSLTNELKNFGVVETKNGLDTKHLTGASEEEVQKIVNVVRNWGNEARDMTPSGLDTLKKKLGDVAGDTNSALANRVYDTAKQQANKIIPGYEKMTAEYAETSDLLRKMKQTFNVSASGGNNEQTISTKLQGLFKQNTNFRELLMNRMPNGSDLLDKIAGLHLNDVMPTKLRTALIGSHAIGGVASAALFHNPAAALTIAPAAAMASPRVIGEGARIAGKIAQSGLPVRDTARRAVTAGANGMLSGRQ